jgi:hypothetical protein
MDSLRPGCRFGRRAAQAVECSGDPDSQELSFIDRACSRLTDTWKKGKNELIFSGYSWHTPWTWTKERRDEENAWAWGGGYGRTVEEANGNTHTVFGLAFLDSHKNIEWQIGYGWSTFWGHATECSRARLYRDDRPAAGYRERNPVPAVLPIVTFGTPGKDRCDLHPQPGRRHQQWQRCCMYSGA